jgi:hypothetical protein
MPTAHPPLPSTHADCIVLSQETHERVLLSFGQGATDEIERTLRIRNMYLTPPRSTCACAVQCSTADCRALKYIFLVDAHARVRWRAVGDAQPDEVRALPQPTV